MEKLQAAVERARQERQANETRNEPSQPRTQAAPKSDASGEPSKNVATAPREGDWEAVPELTLTASAARRRRIFLEGASQQASYFDKLRTKILQLSTDNNWRRIAITSPTKSCGKSTIACNLAASFTRQKDRRLLLLDMDMRRPSIGNYFGHTGKGGMSDVLEGNKRFDDIVFRLKHNVLVAPNHAPHTNPAQLLLQDRTPEILHEIEDQWGPDICLFDTPPLMAADDTLALLKLVDCAIIVAAAEKTTTQQIDVVEREIAEQTNVLGVVINQCLYMDKSEAYYYR